MSSCTASRTITGSGTVTWSASTAARSWPDGPVTRPSASSWARPGRRTSGWWRGGGGTGRACGRRPLCLGGGAPPRRRTSGWGPRRRTPSLRPSPPPGQGHVSATSPAPSARGAAQPAMETRQVSAATASAGTCMRTRMSPTMAGRAGGYGCAAAWRSPSSQCSWPAAATPSGWPPMAGRCIPRMAAALRTWSTRSPSPIPGRASSPCPERRCSASPGREPPEDLLQGALHLGHVRTQLSNIALELSNIALELGNIALELGNIALELGNIALELGNIALEDVHVRGQSAEQTAMPVLGLLDLCRVHPELGQVGSEVGQVGPDCALALSHGLGLARSCPCLQRIHAHL